MANGWKKIQNRVVGNNISIIFKKGSKTIELFRDALWRNKTMNMIVRSTRKKSLVSALGGTLMVKYFDNAKKAKDFATKYMKSN